MVILIIMERMQENNGIELDYSNLHDFILKTRSLSNAYDLGTTGLMVFTPYSRRLIF